MRLFKLFRSKLIGDNTRGLAAQQILYKVIGVWILISRRFEMKVLNDFYFWDFGDFRDTRLIFHKIKHWSHV